VLDDVGLTERTAERFAGEAHLFGGFRLGFAFAGRQEVDGAADLGGDAELLAVLAGMDRLFRRARVDDGLGLRGDQGWRFSGHAAMVRAARGRGNAPNVTFSDAPARL
jgi:hypothetical protein